MKGWQDASLISPSKSGEYLVIWSDGDVSVLDYYIDGDDQGWNYHPIEVKNETVVDKWMIIPKDEANK